MEHFDKNDQIIVFHIDDDEYQLQFTKMFLESENPRLKVVSFDNFDELISKIGEPHDCVLSDFQMPKHNGIKICEIIKTIEEIPFILYTAHGSEEVAQKAFETGVDDYLRKELKPSHYQVLAKRIVQVVEKYRLDRIRVTYKNRFEVLHKYTYEIAAAINLEEIAEKAFEAIKNTLDFSFGGIHFIEGDILVEKFCMSPGKYQQMNLRLDGSGVIIRAINKRKTQVVPDNRLDEDYTPWIYHEDLLSEVAVPIIIEDKVVGAINVESKVLNAFSDEDVRLLETLTSHIASSYSRLCKIQSLQNSERKIKELLDSSMEAAFMLSGTKIVYVNQRGLELLGYKNKSELIERQGFEIVSPSYRERIASIISRLQNLENIGRRYEIPLIRKDGEEVFVETHLNIIEYEGRPALLSFIRDITEKESFELKFTKLYESSVQIFKAKNRDEICSVVLEALESILGFDYGSIGLVEGDNLRFIQTLGFINKGNFLRPLTSKSISTRCIRTGEIQIIPDISKDPDYFVPEVDIETGKRIKSELVVPMKEGWTVLGVINVESMSDFPFEDYEINLVETLAMYSATALSRIAEKENIEHIIESKTKQLLQADRFASLGKVTSMVAHDIRNPLQTIRNAAFFIKEDEKGNVNKIIQAVEYADQIIEEIKSNTIDTPLYRENTNIHEIVMKAIKQVFVPENIQLETQISNELSIVRLDPVKIMRIVGNLINNSIDAMPEGGKILLSANRSKGGLEIKVIDEGNGIPDEVQEVLFSELVTTKPSGTGLGMPFCKRAAEMHGGTIEIESSNENGTVVKVFIPFWTPSDPDGGLFDLVS